MDPHVPSERDFQRFFQSVFEQIVLTSTFIERKFANFTHWTRQSQGRKCSLSLLAAKHITRTLGNTVDTWRQKNDIKRKSLKSRPAWVKKGRVSRLNGFHMFLKEMKAQAEENIQGAADADVFLRQGSYEWSLLSYEAKKEYSEKARAENSQREALKASEATHGFIAGRTLGFVQLWKRR